MKVPLSLLLAPCLLSLAVLLTLQYLPAQSTGWVKVTDTANAVSQYTTNLGYVGATIVDINGDQFPDLHAAPKTIFLNDGDGTFTQAPALPFTPQQGAAGASWADLDNDGDADAVIASLPSKVYFNQGGGTFADSSAQLPGFTNYASWGVAIGDMNEDPRLEIIFAHANGFHPGTPAPCKLYAQGTPAFSPQPVTGYPFTTNLAPYTVPYWSDYDLDGDMDLFIASGPANGTPDYDPCYKNLKIETGTDTLVQMTTELFATHTQDGQCYNFIDYDNDRDLDLCITNYFGAPTRMYRNDTGTYTTVTMPFSTTAANLANTWGDYDNDGDQDVIITTGNQPPKYYRNNGNGTFTYLPTGFTTPTAVCSIANGDIDNDGDLDLFVNGIAGNGSGTSVGLYRNETVATGRNSINLNLIGVQSNRSAIGAIVQLRATINGNPVWQIREVNAQNTFQGQNDLRVHIGLGDATQADTIRITWPSGAVETHHNIPANAHYIVTEGTGIITHNTAPTAHQWTISPNPAQNELHITTWPSLLAMAPTYHISDLQGKHIHTATLTQTTQPIHLHALPPGLYLITLTAGDLHQSKYFMKY